MKSKRCTLLLIAAVVLVAPISAYSPPSDAELAGWWESLTRDERLAEIRKLDVVEHETPMVDVPTYTVTVTDSEVIVAPRGPLSVTVGHLAWEITLPEQRAPYEPATRRWWPTVLTSAAIGACVAFGLVVAFQ